MKNKSAGMDVTNSIRQKAYELWKKEGCKQGHDLDYWLRAEKTLKTQSSKQSRF